MSRKKGHPKTGGREKGTPNRVTSTQRAWVTQLIDDNREQIVKDLAKLEPKDRLMMIEKFMSYSLPKLAATQMQVDFARLSNEQIDDVVGGLLLSIASDIENDNTNNT